MVERKISVDKYLLAGIIATIIFMLGFAAGFVIEKERVNYSQDILTKQRIDSNSLQVQYLYLDSLKSSKNCDAIKGIFNANLVSLDGAMKRLVDYTQNSIADRESFDTTYREYALEEIKYWLLADNVKKICKDDFVTVLFFFTENCDECDSQGYTLDYLKDVFKQKLLVFSFNADLKNEEPMINTLIANYNITKYPSVVIGDEAIGGLANSDLVKSKICKRFSNKYNGCQ